ncbi:FAD-dependent oxidoreductase [Paenibacillus lactis]|uniref:Monooxygenase FAD-binding n=1 Tax=Paenibacillus lactis 154 TaxID=743719 RepID=G4H8R7_9BACL|nr:NAD(P)/FAD-dependent oxidoreductase [Paenibacillus lactis]EHB68252.1 monooxygenase FAD-binding [Paenibacillus lactis 154]
MKSLPVENEQRIAIVGGGPVGLALSVILARYNVPTVILESRSQPTPRHESRAIVWMPRGLELLEWLGLKTTFDKAVVHRTAHEFQAGRRKLMTLSFQDLESPYGYTAQMPQHDTEVLLEEAARQTGVVEIRRNHQVMKVGEEEGQANLTVDSPQGTYIIRAPWAVGTDGAKSTIRKALSIPLKWRDYGTDSAVADFEMEINLPREVSNIVLDPERPYGFFHFGEMKWRFIYRLNQGEDRKQMTSEAAVTELLRKLKPDVSIKRFLWASAFRLGQGQSETYRKGKWLLAGDAAHAMGPSAGAGMMIGLLGAWRLGWRLALAYQGHEAADALLDDYAKEQLAASDEIQDTNAIIFKNMALSNPALARLRSTGLRMASRISSVSKSITAKEALLNQILPVDGSADCIIDGSWKSRKGYGSWILGKRIPFPVQGHQLLLPDQLKHTLVSVGLNDEVEERRYAERLAEQVPVPVNEEICLPEQTSPYRFGKAKSIVFALVRPDQHVAGIFERSV